MGRKGKDVVSIPIPQIDIPRFRFGDKQKGGVGQGDGDPGDPLGQGDEKASRVRARPAATRATTPSRSTSPWTSWRRSWARSSALPDIQDKGKSRISNAHDRYSGIRRVGPESLRHFKRTYREALKRMIASGSFAPTNPSSCPSPTTSASAPGRRSPSPWPTPSSST
jgi:uncharacterized sporulation protein YeaH/YhbH (DUF444 family)